MSSQRWAIATVSLAIADHRRRELDAAVLLGEVTLARTSVFLRDSRSRSCLAMPGPFRSAPCQGKK
jgi:hypothetical protein